MATPADRQAEANDDVERIAAALYRIEAETLCPPVPPLPFNLIPETRRGLYRTVVRRLLLSDVVRVGRRPEAGDPPMEGQTTIETEGDAA